MEQVPNNGFATLDIKYENLTRRLNISDKFLKKTFVVFRADVVEPTYASFECLIKVNISIYRYVFVFISRLFLCREIVSKYF